MSERTGYDRGGWSRTPAGERQQADFAAQRRQQETLERDAFAYRELMDLHELPGDARVGALRRTARGAVEDWLEAKAVEDAD